MVKPMPPAHLRRLGLGMALDVLLLKNEPDRDRPPVVDEDDQEGEGPTRIRCPACGWEPTRHHLWMCSCLHSWNTFETRGVCPACSRRWTETQCPRCSAWSPHDDWYADG
jgi:hypothetical protein